jgi:folate-dependent phosphoribosylglycinamide formyltransferase PurN
MRLGILTSGLGSNMIPLVDAVKSGEMPASDAAVVISDKGNEAVTIVPFHVSAYIDRSVSKMPSPFAS